jgi:DNA-binding Lrp family transcriptional regulator
LDDIDRQIVALLRDGARRSFADLGAHVSLSAPAVKRRVDRLEADGVIRSYAAVVDPAALGWTTHALVELTTEGRMAAAEVRAAVAGLAEVSAAYTVAGEASAVLHVRARDTAHLEETLERLRDTPGIRRTRTQVVLSTLFERPVGWPADWHDAVRATAGIAPDVPDEHIEGMRASDAQRLAALERSESA